MSHVEVPWNLNNNRWCSHLWYQLSDRQMNAKDCRTNWRTSSNHGTSHNSEWEQYQKQLWIIFCWDEMFQYKCNLYHVTTSLNKMIHKQFCHISQSLIWLACQFDKMRNLWIHSKNHLCLSCDNQTQVHTIWRKEILLQTLNWLH